MTTFLASLVVLAVAVVLFAFGGRRLLAQRDDAAIAAGGAPRAVNVPHVEIATPAGARFMGMQRRRLSAKKSLWKRDKRRMRLRLSIRPRELRPRTEHINS